MPRLCAFGCKTSERTTHRFPNPDKFPELFKTWVTLVGGKLEKSSDYEYHRKRIICDIHFKDSDKNRNNRLNKLAAPTLYLPEMNVDNLEILHASQQNTSEQASTSNYEQGSDGAPLQPALSQASTSNYEQGSDGAPLQPALPPSNTEMNIDNLEILHASQQNTGEQASTSNYQQGSNGAPLQAALPPSNTDVFEIPQAPCFPQFQSHSTPSQINYTGIPQDTAAQACARVTMEHNYSVLSRSKFAGGVFGGQGGLKTNSTRTSLGESSSLRTKIKRLRTEISRLRKKSQSFAARLANAEDLTTNPAFQDIVKNMTKPARLFMQMQQQTKKKPKGRRFTIEEKVLSLSVYKKSPKCYALLHKYFTLPSVKAMKRLLGQIKLRPGINPIIFKKIKETVSKQSISDRLCTLMFDEMSLKPQVFYNAQKDTLEGFACNREKSFADHALVFMVKGIKHNFKQPIAYYFTSGLNKMDLKKYIVDVIKHAQQSGLIIVNTVCDQSKVNVGAIKELVNETKKKYKQLQKKWRYEHYEVNGRKIIHIYDTPHLIKGIRNNLLTKDMRYETNGQEKVVKWEYYEMLYAADRTHGELRLVDKLTEEHVNRQKIKKMRVKLATQIFSHSVAVAAQHLSASGDLPHECRQLIDITLMLDNLFDSLNGNTISIPNGKKYKGCVRRNSPHHELWQKCKAVLKTVKFKIKQNMGGNKIRQTEKTVPSVINFIKTIEGMERIWTVLSERFGFDMLLTRNFNQDPLENFFGNIRSYGARNNAPNTTAFEAAFKALLLNNYNSPHSRNANCEDDSNKCLQTLDFFLKERHADVPPEKDVECNAEVFSCDNLPDAGQRNYVCGWVLTKCLKNIVKRCETCRESLVDGQDSDKKNAFLKAKEYSTKRWLCYPTEDFVDCFHGIQNITKAFFKKNVAKINLKKNITAITDVLVDYPFKCVIHTDKLI